ncbi:hypothetical protein KHA80_07680 [Anaerobacillus sp. HL2]|nr:hypothetical protein KHA80_07680 [Anaerobacillus sp. HL2]
MDLVKIFTSNDQWNNISNYLLHSGFNPLEVNQIGKQWKKYIIDPMDTITKKSEEY